MKREKQSIVLVDDHPVIRVALKELIEKLGDYVVCKEFGDGKALLDNYQSISKANLILLDISMPVINGLEVLPKLKALDNQIPVLILTDIDDDSQAVKVFRLGARGYLRKDCTASELNEAMKSIFTSGYYHNKFFFQSIHEDAPIALSKEAVKENILAKLSDKERQFLKLVSHPDEYMYAAIADQMKIPPRAVEKLREELFVKLRIKSKAGLAIFVYRNDLYNSL
jgi:DNA-binding NarL/FixJ family response regulator